MEKGYRRSALQKVLDVAAILVFLDVVIYYVVIWNKLPAKIPSHFNALGEVDGWGGRGSMLPLLIVGFVLWIGIFLLESFPQIYHYPFELTEENEERVRRNSLLMVNMIKNEFLIYMSWLTWVGIRIAFGKTESLGISHHIVFIVVFLGTMGFFIRRMYKLR